MCLVPEACGAFNSEWHDHAIAMLNGPQVATGHSTKVDNTGLYFCETTTAAGVLVFVKVIEVKVVKCARGGGPSGSGA
eukprot:COSAG02_NODE_4035_length_5880_cov_26.342501_1_plen_77_part_10